MENIESDEIGMDYAHMEPRPGEKANNEEEADEGAEGANRKSLLILICSSRKTKWMSCTVVPQKAVCPSAVQTLAKNIGDMMGYKRVMVKSDHQESIKALRKAVGKLKNIQIMKKESQGGNRPARDIRIGCQSRAEADTDIEDSVGKQNWREDRQAQRRTSVASMPIWGIDQQV